MLKRLAIRNYALIDNLDISFSNELNIMTGETGAGKSIILGALSLILGQRAEGKYFFNQQKKCVIEGTFEVNGFQLEDFFTENDLDYDRETVLRREISSDGKTRAFINDTPVNLALLKKLGEKLIDVHSQHATLEINDEEFQLLVIDTVAGNDDLLSEYRKTYKSYRNTQSRLKELISHSEQNKADLDYFQFQFDELEKAGLSAGEQEELEQEQSELTHAEEIKRSLLISIGLLSENEPSAAVQIKEAWISLVNAEKFKPELSKISERLNSALIEIKDLISEIEDFEQRSLINESRLEEVNERLDLLYSLQKKHRVNSDTELITVRDQFSLKISGILFADEDIEKLKTESDKLHQEMTDLANRISKRRTDSIPNVETQVMHTLSEIGMPNAVLQILNESLPDGKFDTNGNNQIRFLFSANKGQSPLPMNKVASGGELSRLMLAIKSLVAVHTSLPTIIFDEIDTGISGEVALRVGNIMEKLSKNMQVIAITHLPQIASKGNTHFCVYKDEESDITHTNIRELHKEERVMELAKMLSGNNPGESAIQNARELLLNF
ncbi:MAG: DNA repair protein RecN [Sphingobacteriales bacterium 17-39-43]|uniref:DNA repair protein RecN n=1 Tax=Daejeonella sp. TaxID=2805397 RepID=UPI000BD0125A|nr:DNA repair protein RecN [Daejeonella sp.]MCF8453428.1 DNA repair protein RecN [Pedobacter sp.]OYZ28746.1 MAG: DNA repair protein RecN [Sphingobacteriales bacterium 16-39-50]OZA22142.1 MAG: DNA repair protein RecN [Sphingobacteriales bacterium 17-39-43]HQT24776.1 DNA repair protein RecN [Daejeonella sp.]HQT59423.1 DNA repair protein RecN [Daejeonella sp.]